ncbi:hypothetical protein AYL99_01304 [Fonsecaea erecta]|uniref:Uncharacterized protein n=1 Tax=Fonsecaea erecta TaxID=1367422 RepID=A0A179A014_9EURO|nr:hypothetical protein AYL99_01304 [Fonsecaea erecta]OAP65332.1 hypothetical protein AYL99_01304 [Fonsecaea erecta]
MPRPAKPPMTLKEAKRAYKKEGGFRYTASQMARADRLDAHEEKRKKELEKEKQRVENKRKREEKLERERNVRQKMLEEGRISVEETWGKVTASQPRLNKFFGQKPALLSSKGAVRAQPIVEEEDMPVADPTAEGQGEKTCAGEDDGLSQKGLADAAAVQGPTAPTSLSSVPTSTAGLGQQEKNHDSTVPISPRQMSSNPALSPGLRELRPSEINSRRLVACQPPNEGKIGSPQRCIGKSWPNPKPPETKATASVVQRRFEGILLPKDKLGSISCESSQGNQEAESAKGGLDTSSMYLDEDFTDGIDDETFLMLCATQKSLPDEPLTRENSPATASLGGTPVPDSPRHKASPSPARTILAQESRTPLSKGLSESFNSVFNEIEDDDLIALAQEVEAEMATPIPTPTIPLIARNMASMAPPPPPRSKALSPLAAQNKMQKPELPRSRLKEKRRLPWNLPRDDFIDLGPSTQALTLELLEQAEANMR